MSISPIIGTTVLRKDGKDKVTGHAKYGADWNISGQLYGAIFHSPVPHAKILKIDTTKAKAYPGVRCVITGADIGNARFGGFIADQPFLAIGKVRYKGEPVAAIAADTERIAKEALKLIEFEYEELPVVDSIEDAISCKGLVNETWKDYTIFGMAHPVEGTNIMDRFELINGDIEEGFKQADVIVENEFRCGMLQHTVMEPHSAIGDVTDDEITIYAPAQSPFSTRSMLHHALGYPLNKIRIICTEIGGGFGSKAEPKLEMLVAVLSKAARRPVKLVYTRDEEFNATFTRASVLYKIKTGATKDGKLCAQKVQVWWDTGAYGGFGPRVNYNAGYASNGPYFIPNAYTDSYCMVTNHSLGSAYRGFGVSEAAQAYEMQMDEVAKALNMDPVEFRLKNVLRDGSVSVTGETMKSVGVAKCLEAASKNLGWSEMPERWVDEDGKLHGKGIACFIKISGTPSTTSCTVRMNEDGTLLINSASREMGQGVRTVLTQFASSVTGISVDRIMVAQTDTSITPYDKTTTSSRSTFHSGNAVLEASHELVRQVTELVAKKWKCNFEDVHLDPETGMFTCKTDDSLSLDINKIGKSGILKEERPIIAVGKYGTKDIFDPVDEKTHASKRPTIMWMMGAQAAEVAIDMKTGKVEVVHISAAHDVGKAINPLGCIQQVEGGLSMGYGHALLEEMIYENGHLKNGNMVDYKVPTFMDSDFKSSIELVEVAHPEGPYGAKGIGEPVVAPTGAAIANAVSAALGRRIHSIPIKPEKIMFGEEGEYASKI
ncbi:MAG: xanthine dehydrogenase family protein [Lachnospiraceae bacterium]|nr:xanthine dehydrogenase family protein [Candidatus Equihabitans merdae]